MAGYQYEILAWDQDCGTICGCIDYSVTTDLPSADPSDNPNGFVYKEVPGANSNRIINIDMTSYPTSSFETEFTVTVRG